MRATLEELQFTLWKGNGRKQIKKKQDFSDGKRILGSVKRCFWAACVSHNQRKKYIVQHWWRVLEQVMAPVTSEQSMSGDLSKLEISRNVFQMKISINQIICNTEFYFSNIQHFRSLSCMRCTICWFWINPDNTNVNTSHNYPFHSCSKPLIIPFRTDFWTSWG